MNRVFWTVTLGWVITFSQAGAEVTLTVSSWVPPTHTLAVSQGKWCDEVAKATAGRVKCNILPKPVSAPPSTFDSIRDGLADISFGVPGYTPGRYVFYADRRVAFLGRVRRIHVRGLSAHSRAPLRQAQRI